MSVVQRHAGAAIDGGTDKTAALVDEGRGSAGSDSSARNVTSTIVKVLRPLGVRGGSKQRHGRKNRHFQPHGATPHCGFSVCPSWLVNPEIVYQRIATSERICVWSHANGRNQAVSRRP